MFAKIKENRRIKQKIARENEMIEAARRRLEIYEEEMIIHLYT